MVDGERRTIFSGLSFDIDAGEIVDLVRSEHVEVLALQETTDDFVNALNSHTHTGVQTGGGSSGAPASPMTIDISDAATSSVVTGG